MSRFHHLGLSDEEREWAEARWDADDDRYQAECRARWALDDRERELAESSNVKRWPDERLQQQLDGFIALYFPTIRDQWTVRHVVFPKISDGTNYLGLCRAPERRILLDLCQRYHRSDRQVRTTLLHELCHASAGYGHELPFFAEAERLLSEGAPYHEQFCMYRDRLGAPDVFAHLPGCQRRAESQARRRAMRRWAAESNPQRRFPFLPPHNCTQPTRPMDAENDLHLPMRCIDRRDATVADRRRGQPVPIVGSSSAVSADAVRVTLSPQLQYSPTDAAFLEVRR